MRVGNVLLVLGLGFVAALLAACVPVPPATPEPSSPAGTVPAIVYSGVLTGTVAYLQRSALPPDAVVQVKLVDVSLADAPATVLAEQQIVTGGKQVPIPFELKYDPATIDQRFSYAVQARIEISGQLRFITKQTFGVLTHGNPATDAKVIVEPVS